MTDTLHNDMYAIGMLARLIWPGPGEMPDATLDQILSRPASGLALMLASGAARKADRDQMTDLVGRISPDLTNGPTPMDAQMRFWSGYYAWLRATDLADRMTIDDLRRIGEALYGKQWQSDMGRALGVDSSRIRQWVSESRRIPPGIWADLIAICHTRARNLGSLVDGILIH